ncbi:MAG: Hsp33 family molecular chaperone HslO [Eubacteriales bacterium]
MSKLLRAMSADGSAQILVLNSTDTVNDAMKIHHCAKTPAVALGRVLTAASMMGSTLKDKGNTVTVNVRGDGVNGHILAVSDYMGNVKGTVQNPGTDSPTQSGRVNMRRAVGKGTLNVVKDTGEKEPYIGIVNLVSGEIAEDVTHYYAESEQVPSVCAIGEVAEGDHFKAAGGFLVMLMPMADPKTVERLEANVEKLGAFSDLLRRNLSNYDIAARVFDGIPFDVFDEYEVGYRCDCSRDRMGKALLTLHPMELYNILAEDHQIELGCQFCGKKFAFTGDDIEKIRIREGKAKPRKTDSN